MSIKTVVLASLLLMLTGAYQLRANNNNLRPRGKSALAASSTRLEPMTLPTPVPLPDLVFSKVDYEEGGMSATPGYHKAKVSFCVRNDGNATAGPFQVRFTIHNGDDQHSGLVGKPRYINFKPMPPGKETCSWVAFQSGKPIFIGKSRLLWIDPGNVGTVKESNENNNKSWTNFPPKGVN